MRRRWVGALGLALASSWGSLAFAGGEGEPIVAPPRALPNGGLIAPVVGIAKQSALHPPANELPQPPTTPPAFKPGSPSLLALRDADCCTPFGGCGSCGIACDECNCGAFASVGFYFIQPFWDSNPAAYFYTLTAGTPASGSQHDFRHDYDPAVLVTAGYTLSNGVGVRVNYWHYNVSSGEDFVNNVADRAIDSAAPLGLGFTSVGNAAAPESVLFDSDLRITVFDFEATHGLTCCHWDLLLAGGLRYAHHSQQYKAFRLDAAAVIVDSLASSHTFNGAGPTVALEARRALGWYELSLYGSGRGSLLYGHGEQRAFLAGTATRTASYQHDDFEPVLEFEVGAEWSGLIGFGELVIQTGLISQTWLGAGNASRSNGPTTTGLPFRGSSVDDANLGLFGLTFSAGLRY